MFTLSLWKNVGAIFVKFTAFIYRTVANAYNLMVDFSSGMQGQELTEQIASLSNSLYSLVLVFMLFRITVSLLQYLIDPDRIGDKNTGTGKLITRIIISIALIVGFPIMIEKVIQPLQTALLSNDSIINNIFKGYEISTNTKSTGSSTTEYQTNAESKEEFYGGKITASSLVTIKSQAEKECAADNIQSYKYRYVKYNSNISQTTGSDTEAIGSYLKGFYTYAESTTGGIVTSATQGTNCVIVIQYTNNKEIAENSEEYGDKFFNVTDYGLSGTTGLQFAKTLVASFTSDYNRIMNSEYLENSNGDNEIAELVEDEALNMDMLMAIIFGIVAIVFLLILSIEVIVRGFKLVILQILAPVAFVCYMNPNDKVFDSWLKKYIGTYLDLFIKLIALRFSVILIQLVDSVVGSSDNLLMRVIYIMAIFLFAKVVPNFISEIFGIKDMGGTFKDAAGILKSGAGMALGTAGTMATALGGSGLMAYSAAKSAGGNNWNKLKAGAKAFGLGAASGVGATAASLFGKKNSRSDFWKKSNERASQYEKGATTSGIIANDTIGKLGFGRINELKKEADKIKERQANFAAADKILDKDKNVLAAQANYDNMFAHGITSYESNDQLATRLGFSKTSSGDYERPSTSGLIGASSEKFDIGKYDSQRQETGTRMATADELKAAKDAIADAKQAALIDPDSKSGAAAGHILATNGEEYARDYKAADSKNKQDSNELFDINQRIAPYSGNK